jgi:hypothetical protein
LEWRKTEQEASEEASPVCFETLFSHGVVVLSLSFLVRTCEREGS